MLDENQMVAAQAIGEAARLTRESLLKSAEDFAASLDRTGAQMNGQDALRAYVEIVNKAWGAAHVA